MAILALKLVMTPLLICAASQAGRRWGEAIGGWFIGLPLTSGPIAFFLAVEQGRHFGAVAAAGSLGGAIAEACFCLAYSAVARRRGWAASLAAGTVGFALGGAALQHADLRPLASALLVCAVLTVTIALLRPSRADTRLALRPPRWDLPARMAVATTLVLSLTGLAPLLGARLSGLIATYPVFAAVLAVFAHHQQGIAAAQRVLRGLMIGLFSFAGFFLVVTTTIERFGIATGFTAATFAALAIQGCSLALMRRPRAI